MNVQVKYYLNDVNFERQRLRISDTGLPCRASTSTVFNRSISSSRTQMVVDSMGKANSNHVLKLSSLANFNITAIAVWNQKNCLKEVMDANVL